jgi:hypothetical protein
VVRTVRGRLSRTIGNASRFCGCDICHRIWNRSRNDGSLSATANVTGIAIALGNGVHHGSDVVTAIANESASWTEMSANGNGNANGSETTSGIGVVVGYCDAPDYGIEIASVVDHFHFHCDGIHWQTLGAPYHAVGMVPTADASVEGASLAEGEDGTAAAYPLMEDQIGASMEAVDGMPVGLPDLPCAEATIEGTIPWAVEAAEEVHEAEQGWASLAPRRLERVSVMV